MILINVVRKRTVLRGDLFCRSRIFRSPTVSSNEHVLPQVSDTKTLHLCRKKITRCDACKFRFSRRQRERWSRQKLNFFFIGDKRKI